MVACAQVAHYSRQAARWGVKTGEVSVDLPAVMAMKEQLVQRFRSGIAGQIEQRENLRLYRGQARFSAAHRVRVGDDELESEHIFINTGTRPLIPAIPGLNSVDYLTNCGILNLAELPEHLLIIGGGYIGLEFGQMFRRFGSRVTIVQRRGQLVPREDPEVAEVLQGALEAEGVRIICNAQARRVEGRGDAVSLEITTPTGEETLTASHLLVAAGRQPNSDDLGLEAAGVEVTERGTIRVNSRLETNVPGIWALGDVNGGPNFTNISDNDYRIVYANLIEGGERSTKGRIVPYAIFTDPQLGRVGRTERQARAAGYRLKIGGIPMSWVARAMERQETAGLMKLVVNAEDDRILGAAILASEGGELVQLLHALMLADAPYTLLKGAIYIHPTLAEGFFTLMENVKPVD